MSERDLEKRQAKAMLYAITVLHLLCLGLLKEPPPVYAESQYAQQVVAEASSLPRV
jgi:hypothetical protein